MAGSAKASVLPVPVCDRPITSAPFLMAGIASCCIGVGALNPISSMAFCIGSLRPSAEKFIWFIHYLL
jgi:hypothetical protein